MELSFFFKQKLKALDIALKAFWNKLIFFNFWWGDPPQLDSWSQKILQLPSPLEEPSSNCQNSFRGMSMIFFPFRGVCFLGEGENRGVSTNYCIILLLWILQMLKNTNAKLILANKNQNSLLTRIKANQNSIFLPFVGAAMASNKRTRGGRGPMSSLGTVTRRMAWDAL